jgi:hypothetical protein
MHSHFFRHIVRGLQALLLLGVSAMAQAIEEPEHSLLDRVGEVEIRRYEAVIQAVTPLQSSAATSAGFRRLAGYIFGANDSGEKISMTAPVQESLGSESPELAFTMPRGYDLDSLPLPDDSVVSLVKVPARTVAVISFGGWATERKIVRYTRELNTALESGPYTVVGTPLLNQYNPPWTPPFLRRNEIMVEIEVIGERLGSNSTGINVDGKVWAL